MLHIYTTCPQSKDVNRGDYIRRIIDISEWSEEFGCDGMLIYTDNSLIDPWLIAQLVVEFTNRLMPLVAVQPIYMHPYAVAKLVASIAHLYDRRIALNMLAGGFRNDLIALGDTTEHDDRYLRTTEYTLIIRRLLEGDGPTDFTGKYYSVKNLKMTPALPRELFPEILISGSSQAGMAAAKAIGATAIMYPRPAAELEPAERDAKCGVRVGLIVREDTARILLHIDELAAPLHTAAQGAQAPAQHGFGLVLGDRQSEWIGRRQAAEVGDQESAGRRADHKLRRPQAVLKQQRRRAQWFEREQGAGVQYDRSRAVLTSLGLIDQHRLDAAAGEGDSQCQPGRTCAGDED